METTKQTSKEYFKTLSILHLALTSGVLFFGLIVSFLILTGTMSNNSTDLDSIFMYLIPVLILGGLFAGNRIYKNKLAGLKESTDLKAKMTNYRSILINRYAFLEAPAFFALVAVMLTSNLLYLVFAGIMIMFMIYWRPTRNSVIADLELSQQEISVIESPDSIIAEVTNTKH